jgi:excisionase family DNA binding protein
MNCPVSRSEVIMDKPGSPIPTVDFNFISVKDAAYQCGYNIQYLRRMLRSGALNGVKIGQMWLIEIDALEAYLKRTEDTSDRRCGPR